MPLRSAFLIAALTTIIPAAQALAGGFVFSTSCDTLSVNPLRVRLGFHIYDIRLALPLCRATFEPSSSEGSVPRAALDAVANAPFTAERDSATGVVTFRASPCLEFVDPGLEAGALITDGLPVSFLALAYPEGGSPMESDLVTFTGREATPVAPSTWGRLKVLYR
jgi:hypothetical protein